MRMTILAMAAAIGAAAFAVSATADAQTRGPTANYAAPAATYQSESWAKVPATACPAGSWWQVPQKDEWGVWRPGRCVASL